MPSPIIAVVAAIKVDDVATLKRYLAGGGDPNATDGTAKGTSLLHWAAYLGSVPCVTSILEDPSAFVNITEVDGKTPLHWAAFEGYCDVIEVLCQHGARANVADSLGHTPYALAQMQKHYEAAGLLKLIGDHQEQQERQRLAAEDAEAEQRHQAAAANEAAAAAAAREQVSPARSVAAVEPPVLLVPRALSPVQQMEALRASSAASSSSAARRRRDVWPTLADDSSAHSLQQRSTLENGDGDELEFEIEAETLQRRAFLARVRGEQQTIGAGQNGASSQREGSAEATERLLDDARAHVEQHERRHHGSEFSALDEELRQERLEAARQERKALEREQRRIDKLERKLARQEARRRRRAEWLEQVMRLAALSHDVPRDDYVRIMEQIAQSYASSGGGGAEPSSAALSRGTSLSRQSSSHRHGSEPDTYNEDEEVVMADGEAHSYASPFKRTQPPLQEGPRDAAQWLPNPQPGLSSSFLAQHLHAVPPLSLAHWRNQLTAGASANPSAPNTARSNNHHAQNGGAAASRSNSARSGPSSARSRVREPVTRYPPSVDPFVPLSQVLDRRPRRAQSAAERRRSASAMSDPDAGLRHEAWKPPAASRIEDVAIRACQVTVLSRSRPVKPVAAKVNARR